MKILFVTNASGPDYMSDMVFHGGKTTEGIEMYESTKLSYMYDDLTNKNNLYGQGFTIYGKINSSLFLEMPSDVSELIQNKFFDKIIYGSIWRCDDYFNIVSKSYSKEDIIIIDGEDEMDRINYNYLGGGLYFKREYYNKINGVYPINFGVPSELVIDKIGDKKKLISDIIPNSNKNYSFSDEKDYYIEYSNSWYAHTKKKAGWDCLRHYEIMMNGCIPLFEDLENCPINTLVNLPKKEIINFSKYKEQNLEQNDFILDYTKRNLTTKNIIQNILQ
jgi:hypothetical protein